MLEMHMHFRLLGHLEVVASNGSLIEFSGPLGRAIVARLILAEGRPVQSETLIDELWGERAARNPVNALQVQMTKLRTSFAARGEEGRLEMRSGGYRLVLSNTTVSTSSSSRMTSAAVGKPWAKGITRRRKKDCGTPWHCGGAPLSRT